MKYLNKKHLPHKRQKKVTFFLFRESLLFLLYIIFPNSTAENQKPCEIYYEEYNRIYCVAADNSTIPADIKDYNILQVNCKDDNSTGYIKPPHFNATAFAIEFKSCRLRSGVFEYLLLSIGVFESDENNTNPILMNNSFKGICSVKYIGASKNFIEIIEPRAFECLKNIAELDLSNNRIKYLPDDVFRDMQYLTSLNLLMNSLSTLSTYSKSRRQVDEIETDKQLNNSRLNSTSTGFVDIHNVSPIVDVDSQLKVDTSKIFSSLIRLEVLNLNYNNISDVSGQPFRYNSMLKTLYLTGNSILDIKDTFKGLSSLKSLYLEGNRIVNIDESFTELIQLEELKLDNNFISDLQKTDPSKSPLSPLKNLQNLYVNNNKITYLSNVFNHNPKLKKLEISRNWGLVLTSDAFIGLSGLEILKIDNCNITNIPNGTFLATPELTQLFLYKNKLHTIHSDTFKGLLNMKILDISENEISSLIGQPFSQKKKLIKLSMFRNNISELKSDVFQDLSYLKMLDISKNVIHKIENNSFQPFFFLNFLNISHNLIPSMTDLLNSNNKLREVDISYNSLSEFSHGSWGEHSSLKVIRATNNKIKSLLPWYLPAAEIHLEWNDIKIIHLGEENMPSLENGKEIQIYLTGNPLECDCHAYGIYKYLKDNSSQVIKFMDDLICRYPIYHRERKILSLKPYEFICNIIEFCPESCICTLFGHNNAIWLDCNNKNLYSLPLQAPYNTTLLDIRNNKLNSLVQLNDTLWENITTVFADRNIIVNEEFHVPNRLKFLGLSNNKLKELPKCIKNRVEEMKDFKVTLSSNLWPCDCSVLNFKTFLSEYRMQVDDVSKVRCMFPNNTASTTILKKMEFIELCPNFQDYQVIILLCVSGIIVMVLFASCMILYCTRKMCVLSFLYIHFKTCYTLFSCCSPNEEEKLFDCFISYSSSDKEVALSILNNLEEPVICKFCANEPNWIPGKFTTTNIIESIQNSRKILIILSKDFLKSESFHLVFQEAYRRTLKDRKDRLILVLKGDLPDERELEADLQVVLSTKAFLEWGERCFWEKLRYSMYEGTGFIEIRQENRSRSTLTFWKKDNEEEENITLDEIS